jgi:hypothetical protein
VVGFQTTRRNEYGQNGSRDKPSMMWLEQTLGHAPLAVSEPADPEMLSANLYSRGQSVVGSMPGR